MPKGEMMKPKAEQLQMLRRKFLAGDIPRGLLEQEISYVIYGGTEQWPEMDRACSYPPVAKEMIANWIMERK